MKAKQKYSVGTYYEVEHEGKKVLAAFMGRYKDKLSFSYLGNNKIEEVFINGKNSSS